MKRIALLLLFSAFLLLPPLLMAQIEENVPAETDEILIPPTPPAPPTNVAAFDANNDDGHAINIKWDLSVDDGGGQNSVIGYEIYRAESASADDAWEKRTVVSSGTSEYKDKGGDDEEKADYFPKNADFYYRVNALSGESFSVSNVFGPVQATDEWFDTSRIIVLVFVGMFLLFTLIYIRVAKTAKDLYIRPLAGIEAIDDAIGRATEMGKPILYVFGLGTAADIATIASFSILSRVAKKVAEYQTPLLVPIYDPIVLTVAEDTVKAAYLDAGHPDEYKEDCVYFVTQSQFAYVAAVNGTMLREKPATNFYLGKFYAESLLLAETGALAGSIQIAGTDETTQLPFFIVACDYTLIGEELYAASAYLNREPVLLGTLKAQDMAKALVMVGIVFFLILRIIYDVNLLESIFSIAS